MGYRRKSQDMTVGYLLEMQKTHDTKVERQEEERRQLADEKVQQELLLGREKLLRERERLLRERQQLLLEREQLRQNGHLHQHVVYEGKRRLDAVLVPLLHRIYCIMSDLLWSRMLCRW